MQLQSFPDNTHVPVHHWADVEGLHWPDVPGRSFYHCFDITSMLANNRKCEPSELTWNFLIEISDWWCNAQRNAQRKAQRNVHRNESLRHLPMVIFDGCPTYQRRHSNKNLTNVILPRPAQTYVCCLGSAWGVEPIKCWCRWDPGIKTKISILQPIPIQPNY